MIGRTLGHFEIQSKIGAGGMGEVYRARDTRLNRTVAIKVLPAGLSHDEAFRSRLKREAMAVSRLNHPHVCTLHDIGHEGDADYLVFEFIEGVSLADRLESGPLPLPEALALAAQVADGLDAAHRLGIVHRDLKPGNVMLTASGAKLLDFGLAKERDAIGGAVTLSATRPMDQAHGPPTAEGTVLGTLQYMAPEQLHGEAADARSDLFSFGAMLYEMLTGEAAFQGKSPASVIASILHEDPPSITHRMPLAPRALERLVARCLSKDPAFRYQNARDVMLDLQWIAGGAEGEATSLMPPARRRLPILAMAGVTILAGFAAGAFVGHHWKQKPMPAPDLPTVRAEISLPEGHRIAGWASPTVAISDDGSTLAFVTISPEGKQQLFVRPLDAEASTLVPDSETAEGPVFSPDGQWVLFAVGVSTPSPNIHPELRKYSLQSGLTQTLCPVDDYFGADWGADGTIVWSDRIGSGLWRIGADGGGKENFLTALTMKDPEHPVFAGWPTFLPDGRHMLVSVILGSRFLRGGVLDLETGTCSDLGVDCTAQMLLPGGRLAWVDLRGTVMVAPFDAAGRRLSGTGRAVDRNISMGGAGRSVLAVAGNGTAVLTRGPILGSPRNTRRMVRVGVDGSQAPLSIDAGPVGSFGLAQAGDRVALASIDGLLIHDLERGIVTDLRLGDVMPFPSRILWSPDGAWIAFRGMAETSTTIDAYVVATDGSSIPRRVYKAESECRPLAWEGDGKVLVVADYGMAPGHLLRVPMDGGPPLELDLGAGRVDEVQLAPQGDLVSYLQPQGDTVTLLVRTYPDLGPPVPVASGNYWWILWSEDGRELYAITSDGVEAFQLERSPRLAVRGRRHVKGALGEVSQLEVAPGGKGFYALEEVPGAGVVTKIEVAVNWVNGLP